MKSKFVVDLRNIDVRLPCYLDFIEDSHSLSFTIDVIIVENIIRQEKLLFELERPLLGSSGIRVKTYFGHQYRGKWIDLPIDRTFKVVNMKPNHDNAEIYIMIDPVVIRYSKVLFKE